ncbi:hypothetical protein AX17_002546 [Amanita inopinata Kibby_2008]|nr:hypothetical protein AX17_002546 [Amanita inopinata Kibby_2008]
MVLNKRDLVSEWGMEPFRRAMANKFPEQRVLFASWHRPRDIRQLGDLLVSIAKQYPHAMEHNVLVIGMPNVGKSTLLNALRNMGIKGPTPKALRTSAQPGLTQALSTRLKISLDPLVYAFDSPGVMLPFLGQGTEGAERGVKLALIAGIKEGLYDMETLSAYLLYRLNVLNPTAPAYLKLFPDTPSPRSSQQSPTPPFPSSPSSLPSIPPSPANDVTDFLTLLARRMGMIKRGAEPDLARAATYFVRWWREEGGLVSATAAVPASLALGMYQNPVSEVGVIQGSGVEARAGTGNGNGNGNRNESGTVARSVRPVVQGWGFDFEWQLEPEEVLACRGNGARLPASSSLPFASTSASASDMSKFGAAELLVQRKMESCIDDFLVQREREDKEGGDVSKTQKRKREVDEEKKRRAAKWMVKAAGKG